MKLVNWSKRLTGKMSNVAVPAITTVPYENLKPRWWVNSPVVPSIEYDTVAEYPREIIANLIFRTRMSRLATANPDIANDLWIKCSRDILFFINTFVYTYDPRLIDTTPEQPFITYPFQDMAILELRDSVLKGEDILIEKSRDMGATWICLVVLMWFWMFKDMTTFMVVSRKESLVDRSDDPDALMWKLDFMYDRMPSWLSPKMKRTNLHFGNKDNQSTLDGEATTGDLGRGGRRTAMLLDEYAKMPDGVAVSKATADVTQCRFFIFTPEGTGNDAYTKRESGMNVLTLHWSLHPVKAKGCYIGVDGKLHSPWYDKECQRRSPVEIAQELDIDYGASDSQFFTPDRLADVIQRYVHAPYYTGVLDYSETSISNVELEERNDGYLKVWQHLDFDKKPPTDRRYVIGCDIATGSGSSYTVFSVFDCKTHEKVAEFASNTMTQVDAAEVAVALGRFYKGSWNKEAYLIWEANGPGGLFGRKVLEYKYSNIYYHTEEKSISKKQMAYINHSHESMRQCGFYVFKNGSVVHARSAGTNDPTNQSDNHGDQVIADALSWKAAKLVENITELSVHDDENSYTERTPMAGTLAFRRQAYELEVAEGAIWQMVKM